MYQIIVCLVVGYVCGCFSTGYFVGKVNHTDIRQHGSGNAGTTNALRTLGVKAGILTLLGDAFKAVIPILVLRYIFKDASIGPELITLYTGLGAVIGHNYPCWLKFKGGKGIATTAGVILSFDLRITLICLIVFIIVVAITRYVSVGSLLVSILLPLGIVVFYPDNVHFVHMLCVSLIYTALAFYRHRANILRLIKGTENKLGQKTK